jgi:hypothetical protein
MTRASWAASAPRSSSITTSAFRFAVQRVPFSSTGSDNLCLLSQTPICKNFVDLSRGAGCYDLVPQSVWEKEWVCHIEPVGSGETTLKYLAPYIYRGPISDRNILHVQKDRVTFQYKDREDKTFKTCTLEALEFLRRFFQHVLPRGFVRVRYFGFLATKKRADLTFIKERIGKRLSCKKISYPKKPQKIMTCPDCGQVLLFICEIPKLRGPP